MLTIKNISIFFFWFLNVSNFYKRSSENLDIKQNYSLLPKFNQIKLILMKIVSLLQVKLPLVCDIMCTMDIFLLALPMFIMVGLSIHMFTRAPSPHFNPFPVDDDYIGHNELKSFLKDHSKAESFYYVNYGSSIINYCVKS